MKIASPKPNTSHLSLNERAIVACETALALQDRGDYQGAQDAMRHLWGGVGELPNLEGLHETVSAEVRLCVGILTRWIGSKNQISGAQEAAKNLITESITFYESVGDNKKIAAAQVELACCYWREGALDEARITLKEALKVLIIEGTTRARALLRLAIVEWSAARYSDSLKILSDSSPLFNRIKNSALRGAYHSQFALVLRALATHENREEYFRRAVNEYEKADVEFKQARNAIFRADVQNNLGYLLFKLGRNREAEASLLNARRLAVSTKDRIRTAQIDETRAQILLAEKNSKKQTQFCARRFRFSRDVTINVFLRML